MILIFSLKFGLFESQDCSSALSENFFIGTFQGLSSFMVSVYTFLQFRISCSLEAPVSGYFPSAAIIVFVKHIAM